MSESRIYLRPEVADLLQESCRDCLYARNLLSKQLSPDSGDPIPQEVIDDAARINAGCAGWQGPENPNESLINGEDGPAMAMSRSLEQNCPYAAGNL